MTIGTHHREAFWEYVKGFIQNDSFLSEHVEMIPGGCNHYCTIAIKSSELKNRLAPYKCQIIELSVASTRPLPCIWYIFNNEDNRNNLMDVISNYYINNDIGGELQSIANEHGNDGGRVKFIIYRNREIRKIVANEARALYFLLKKSILAILNS